MVGGIFLSSPRNTFRFLVYNISLYFHKSYGKSALSQRYCTCRSLKAIGVDFFFGKV